MLELSSRHNYCFVVSCNFLPTATNIGGILLPGELCTLQQHPRYPILVGCDRRRIIALDTRSGWVCAFFFDGMEWDVSWATGDVCERIFDDCCSMSGDHLIVKLSTVSGAVGISRLAHQTQKSVTNKRCAGMVLTRWVATGSWGLGGRLFSTIIRVSPHGIVVAGEVHIWLKNLNGQHALVGNYTPSTPELRNVKMNMKRSSFQKRASFFGPWMLFS